MVTNAESGSITKIHEEKLENLEKNQTQIQTQLDEIKTKFQENQSLIQGQLQSFETQMQSLENAVVELIKEIKQLQTSMRACPTEKSREEPKESHMHDPVINHFSHPHPLDLTSTQQAKISGQCRGCKLQPSGSIYTCNPCSYILHVSCSQMPQFINHPTDLKHPLSLLSLPAYSFGRFCCDACGRNGDGFSYHCALCRVDIHIQCVSMPLTLAHPEHRHPLALTFFPPYTPNRFHCDICGDEVGDKYWRYRCNECDFDAHLYCAREVVQEAVQQSEGLPQQGKQPPMRMNDPPSKQQATEPKELKGKLRTSAGLIKQRIINAAAEQLGHDIVHGIVNSIFDG